MSEDYIELLKSQYDRRIKGLSDEIAQLLAANAELQRKHGLLAAEVTKTRQRNLRMSPGKEQRDKDDAEVLEAMAATDAGGALEEVGG